jgi:DNA-binding transcriptional LysR family regulator
MNIQFRYVRSFIAVASEASFARAAKRLHVSQPALSQTIIQCEQDIGVPLFERTTRSVVLTPAGQQVLEQALKLGKAMDLFHGELHAIRSALKATLRVGFMIGTAVQFLPEIAREFEKLRPDAQLLLEEFNFSDPSAGLGDGKVDCGLIRPPIGMDDIEVVEIAREKCVACLPSEHRLTLAKSVTLADILDEPIIAAPSRGIWREYWLASEHRHGRPAKVSFEAATVESELQAVASGKGISITSESTGNYYARPGVVFKPIEDMPECVIAIGYRPNSNSLIADFIQVARLVAGKMIRLEPAATTRANPAAADTSAGYGVELRRISSASGAGTG